MQSPPRTAGLGVTAARETPDAVEPALPLQHGEQEVVIHVASRRDHAVAPVISRPMQRLQVLRRQRLQTLRRAEDRVAVGMVRPERSGMQLEHEIVGRIGHAVDLLQHHVTLGLEVAFAKEGPANQVGKNLDRQRQVGVEDMGLVAGVIAPGKRVEPTAVPPARARAPERSGARCP